MVDVDGEVTEKVTLPGCYNLSFLSMIWFLPSEEDHRIAGWILSVDMEDKFRVIELPEEVTEHAFLVNLDGHLGLVAIYDDGEIMDVWLLKQDDEANDYGDKKCSDYIPYPTTECPDSVAGRDNELFVITMEYYFIYDIGSMIWLELDFSNEFERNCPAVFSFPESLFACKFTNFYFFCQLKFSPMFEARKS